MSKNILILIIIGLASLVSLTAQAQKIKLKKGIVSLDGAPYLKYDRELVGGNFNIFSLSTDEQLVEIHINDNETDSFDDDYVQIRFIEEGQVVEMNKDQTNKQLIKLMVRNKVLTKEGGIDPERVKKFVKTYDQNITNRTIRW